MQIELFYGDVLAWRRKNNLYLHVLEAIAKEKITWRDAVRYTSAD